MDRDFDSPEEEARLDRLRTLIESELPDLMTKGQRLHDAAEEQSLSGELRRAVHKCDLPITQIAERAGLTLLELDAFLTGDATIPSDAMDRLVEALGYSFKESVRVPKAG